MVMAMSCLNVARAAGGYDGELLPFFPDFDLVDLEVDSPFLLSEDELLSVLLLLPDSLSAFLAFLYPSLR
jgi:hypothetical protein